ncbi:C39 family peptidase [Methanosarcina sp.]|jgi:hypothetical protein|uniref:C39 family peptidase n=1 Tax=Methanosarcina sp. TaxID=2213 RepID=UPI002CD1B916|nr:C39 family peptidase [Methanosarcina sp.]HOW13530.1 C39 family peptidase [Methanosarcina sp.]
MKRNKCGTGIFVLAMLLAGMVFIPAASAQEEKDYSVTAEEAFKHANTHMIFFIAVDSDFAEWKEASIDPKPLELYDINDKKLFYEFSVCKNNEVIGNIKVCADKKLGQSVQSLEFNPKSFDANEAIKKSIEIAKNTYLTGEIKSTKMVVYNYPDVGAMTVVKDKTTGNEHRIFVDAYTLEVIPDKPATETENGVWSFYEDRLKNGIDKNLKDWQESDNVSKFIEQETTEKGSNTSAPITEEKISALSSDATITSTTTTKTLNVPLCAQETSYYCAVASAQMIAKYYGITTHSQSYIYQIMGGTGGTLNNTQQLVYYQGSNGLNKPGSIYVTSGLTFNSAVAEINSNRPFKSAITNHARVCRGYTYTSDGIQYLKINDPAPVGSGSNKIESPGQEINRIYVRS